MRLNKALSVANNFKELIGLLSFYILLFANPLSPDLDVNYEKSDYFVQNNTEITKINKSGNSSILTLILANKSKNPITDMEIEIRGIVKVDSIGGRSSSIRINNEIQKYVEFEEKENYRIFLKNATELPAGHNIQIQIIGQFLDLIIEDRVNITSSAKSQSITEMSKVTGLWVFVYSQSTTLFSVLAAVLIFLGLKRLHQEGVVV